MKPRSSEQLGQKAIPGFLLLHQRPLPSGSHVLPQGCICLNSWAISHEQFWGHRSTEPKGPSSHIALLVTPLSLIKVLHLLRLFVASDGLILMHELRAEVYTRAHHSMGSDKWRLTCICVVQSRDTAPEVLRSASSSLPLPSHPWQVLISLPSP